MADSFASRGTAGWIGVGVWLGLTCLGASGAYAFSELNSHAVPAWRLFALSGITWSFWLLVAPFIGRMARLVPYERTRRVRFALVHGGLGALAASADGVAMTWAGLFLVPSPNRHPSVGLFVASGIDWLPVGMFVYWTLLSLRMAMDYQARYYAARLQASEMATQLSRAELNGLRAQLQPHFLFNALNTAVGLLRTERPALSIRVLTDLGEVLRHVLRDSDHEVPLADEVEFIVRYLQIENIRFGDRLAFECEIPPELAGALVPSLILQPLVENAVRHGLAPLHRGGRIRVSSFREGTQLVVSVVDNGVGIGMTRASTRAGIGIPNCRARLYQLYGAAQSLTIAPNRDGGTEVRLCIPFTMVSAFGPSTPLPHA